MTYAPIFPCSLAPHRRLPWWTRLWDRILARPRAPYRCERCKNCRDSDRIRELIEEFDRRHT